MSFCEKNLPIGEGKIRFQMSSVNFDDCKSAYLLIDNNTFHLECVKIKLTYRPEWKDTFIEYWFNIPSFLEYNCYEACVSFGLEGDFRERPDYFCGREDNFNPTINAIEFDEGRSIPKWSATDLEYGATEYTGKTSHPNTCVVEYKF